jgi:prepilin-type N-terminal cleavage/methylation domain-containing protein
MKGQTSQIGLQIRKDGFTLIELLTTIAIVGVLSSISVSTFNSYRLKAEYVVLQTTVRFLMNAQDIYLLDNGKFYPERGNVHIRTGESVNIPELLYKFPAGHKHDYTIYGRNIDNRGQQINMYYIEVRADYDFDGNGREDRFRFTTLIRDGDIISNREFRQYS